MHAALRNVDRNGLVGACRHRQRHAGHSVGAGRCASTSPRPSTGAAARRLTPTPRSGVATWWSISPAPQRHGAFCSLAIPATSADFRAIRQRLGRRGFFGAAHRRLSARDFMKKMHVNPADAVQLMLDLEAKQAMGVHWGRPRTDPGSRLTHRRAIWRWHLRRAAWRQTGSGC